MQPDLPFTISTASKAERGYALLEGKPAQPQKAVPIHLAAEGPAGEAFRDIARGCLTQFLANQAVLVASRPPEAIHQMRVALRRLRSAITIFKGFLDTPESQWLKGELRWLLAPLGTARDGDVFREEVLAPLTAILADEPGYALLCDDFDEQHRTAYAAVLDLQKAPRLTRLLLGLGRWIEAGDWLQGEDSTAHGLRQSSTRQLAETTLVRLEHKVARRIRHLKRADAEARHETQILVKKLRYAIDFFQTLFPGSKAKRLGTQLGVLQDRLGVLNDIAVARLRLAQHAESKGDVARLRAAGMIAGWHLAESTPWSPRPSRTGAPMTSCRGFGCAGRISRSLPRRRRRPIR